MAEEKPHNSPEKPAAGERLRRAALFVLFSAVLLLPRMLALRRRRGLWMNLRFGATLAGVALVLATGGEWGWVSAAGVALLLLALLARPAKEGKSVDEQARELGALVVVNGGRLRREGDLPVETRLFVSPGRVNVLDREHRRLLEIPLEDVSTVRVEKAGESWQLKIEWHDGSAVFSYRGFFAEHLARVAETTLNNQRRAELPVLK